jgi:RNA polymerase sigma factor for flagellar operon FliA
VTNVDPITSKLFILPRFAKDFGVHRRVPVHKPATRTSHLPGKVMRDDSPEPDRRNTLVLENLHIVRAIAARVRGSLPVHVDTDDLIQAGTLGLMDAAKKFDHTKQVAFSSYAKHRIKGAILDSLRELDEASRDLRRFDKQVGLATRSLTDSLERAPDESEVAEKLGISVEKLRAKLLHIRSVSPRSSSSRMEEDTPVLESPAKPETHPDASFAQKELQNTVRAAMKGLSQSEQKVLLLYYNGEKKMKEIGGILGVNESRVSQIRKRALQRMEVQLRAQGITSGHPL